MVVHPDHNHPPGGAGAPAPSSSRQEESMDDGNNNTLSVDATDDDSVPTSTTTTTSRRMTPKKKNHDQEEEQQWWSLSSMTSSSISPSCCSSSSEDTCSTLPTAPTTTNEQQIRSIMEWNNRAVEWINNVMTMRMTTTTTTMLTAHDDDDDGHHHQQQQQQQEKEEHFGSMGQLCLQLALNTICQVTDYTINHDTLDHLLQVAYENKDNGNCKCATPNATQEQGCIIGGGGGDDGGNIIKGSNICLPSFRSCSSLTDEQQQQQQEPSSDDLRRLRQYKELYIYQRTMYDEGMDMLLGRHGNPLRLFEEEEVRDGTCTMTTSTTNTSSRTIYSMIGTICYNLALLHRHSSSSSCTTCTDMNSNDNKSAATKPTTDTTDTTTVKQDNNDHQDVLAYKYFAQAWIMSQLEEEEVANTTTTTTTGAASVVEEKKQQDETPSMESSVVDSFSSLRTKVAILHHMAKIQYHHGHYDDAIQLYELALSYIKKNSGHQGDPSSSSSSSSLSLELASTLNCLGVLHMHRASDDARRRHNKYNREMSHRMTTSTTKQQHQHALSYLQESLDIVRRRQHSDDDDDDKNKNNMCDDMYSMDVGTILHNIGRVHDCLGQYDIAIGQYIQALTIRQQEEAKVQQQETPTSSSTYSQAQPIDVAFAMLNLGQALQRSSSSCCYRGLVRPLQLKQQAQIEQQEEGEHHHDRQCQLFLAMSCYKDFLNRMQEITPAKSCTILTNGDYFEDDRRNCIHHRDVGVAYQGLGEIFYEIGELDFARDRFYDAIHVFKVLLGPYHTKVAHILNKLGNLLYELVDIEEALDVFKESLHVDRVIHHYNMTDPSSTSTTSSTVSSGAAGTMSSTTTSAAAAAPASTTTTSTATRDSGNSYTYYHPNIIVSLTNIGHVYSYSRDHAMALQYYMEAYEMQCCNYGGSTDDVRLLSLVSRIALMHYKLKDYALSLTMYRKALLFEELKYGPNTLQVASTQNTIGLVLFELGDDLSEALKFCTRSLKIRTREYSATNLETTGSSTSTTADESSGENGTTTSKYPLHSEVAAVLFNIAQIHQSMENDEQAIQCYKETVRIEEGILRNKCNKKRSKSSSCTVSTTSDGDDDKLSTKRRRVDPHHHQQQEVEAEQKQEEHEDAVALNCNTGSEGRTEEMFHCYNKDEAGDEYDDDDDDEEEEEDEEDDFTVVGPLRKIAEVYMNRGDMERCIAYYRKVLKFQKNRKYPQEMHISSTLKKIGGFYLQMDDIGTAMKYFSSASRYYRRPFGGGSRRSKQQEEEGNAPPAGDQTSATTTSATSSATSSVVVSSSTASSSSSSSRMTSPFPYNYETHYLRHDSLPIVEFKLYELSKVHPKCAPMA